MDGFLERVGDQGMPVALTFITLGAPSFLASVHGSA